MLKSHSNKIKSLDDNHMNEGNTNLEIVYEFDLVYINLFRRDSREASSFSIILKNISNLDGFLNGYGKWVIIGFVVLGIVSIVICVFCCYSKAKKDRADMISKHMDNS